MPLQLLIANEEKGASRKTDRLTCYRRVLTKSLLFHYMSTTNQSTPHNIHGESTLHRRFSILHEIEKVNERRKGGERDQNLAQGRCDEFFCEYLSDSGTWALNVGLKT